MSEVDDLVPGSGDFYKKDQVVKIINSVLSKAEASTDLPANSMVDDLRELQIIIQDMRADVGSVGAADIQGKHIPAATDELDAVIESTAEASGKIMDACDAIQDKVSAADEAVSQAVIDEVMKIYEACSFQDLTGQRITKVVSALKIIEDKVARMIGSVSSLVPDIAFVSEGEDAGKTEDEKLLNGPQLTGQGVSQDDIDAILSQFDE